MKVAFNQIFIQQQLYQYRYYMKNDTKSPLAGQTGFQNSKIYFREIDGTSYEADYDSLKLLSEILFIIYQRQLPNDSLLICKGKRLTPQKTLKENNIAEDSIIHILKVNPKYEQKSNSIVYISFQDKLHRIQFQQDENLDQFKKRIEKYTKVPASMQVLLHNGCFLQENKNLSEYGLKNQEMIHMGKIELNAQNNGIFQFPQRIFPVNINSRTRRGSEGLLLPSQFPQQAEQIWNYSNYELTSKSLQQKCQKNKIQNNQENFSPNMSKNMDQYQTGLIKQWKSTKSQEGNDSPVISKQFIGLENDHKNKQKGKPSSIFAMNNFQKCAQQFNFRFQSDQNDDFRKDSLSPFNFVEEFNQQDVVFCESYYEEVATLKTNQLSKKESKQQESIVQKASEQNSQENQNNQTTKNILAEQKNTQKIEENVL